MDQARMREPHVLELAKRISEAVDKDEGDEGCDISAGLFGPAFSELVVEMADHATKEKIAERLLDVWINATGKPVPWAKAVEITAIVIGMPNAEKDRLLGLDTAPL